MRAIFSLFCPRNHNVSEQFLLSVALGAMYLCSSVGHARQSLGSAAMHDPTKTIICILCNVWEVLGVS